MAEIGAVLLAAGASQRFGPDKKLLANIRGKPLIRWVAEEIVDSGAEAVVVTGCDRWMAKHHPDIPFERFADDVVCHCSSEHPLTVGVLSDRP
jgi:molybdenum cofactor cytidylyltransferase